MPVGHHMPPGQIPVCRHDVSCNLCIRALGGRKNRGGDEATNVSRRTRENRIFRCPFRGAAGITSSRLSSGNVHTIHEYKYRTLLYTSSLLFLCCCSARHKKRASAKGLKEISILHCSLVISIADLGKGKLLYSSNNEARLVPYTN